MTKPKGDTVITKKKRYEARTLYVLQDIGVPNAEEHLVKA